MSLVVRPVRFTDDLPAMRAFLELLGLLPRIESPRGGWVDLVGSSGMVALHSAAGSVSGALPGQTDLSFEVPDASGLATRLRAAGFSDAVVYDEAYGRVLTVTDPLGSQVAIDEASSDLYGYVAHPVGSLAAAPGVVPVRFTDDATGYHGFLAALGLVGAPDPGGYATYDCPGGGSVGVHYVYGSELPILGAGAPVHLTLTVADLDVVEARVRAAGVPCERQDEDFGSFLDLTDPDGQSVQVHGVG